MNYLPLVAIVLTGCLKSAAGDRCTVTSQCVTGASCTEGVCRLGTLNATTGISLVPASVTLSVQTTQTFTTDHDAVAWLIEEGAVAGAIDSAGVYTAGRVPGIYHVIAKDTRSPRVRGVAEVSVRPTILVTTTMPALPIGDSTTLAATLNGSVSSDQQALTWTVVERGGGTIEGFVYHAPDTAGVYHLTVTSVTFPDVSVTIPVKVLVNVTVAPTDVTLTVGETHQYTATILGSTDQAVTWSIAEGVGSVTNGLVTAPNTEGLYHVVATAVSDPSRSASAAFRVSPALKVTPPASSVVVGHTKQFSAAVIGATDQSVTWTILSGDGSISPSGLYTATATPQVVTIRTQSVQFPTRIVDTKLNVIRQEVRIDVNSSGSAYAFAADAYQAVLSADCRFVVFASKAHGLYNDVPSYTPDARAHLFVHDRLDGTTRVIDIQTPTAATPDGILSASGGDLPAISADGSILLFHGPGGNLVPGGDFGSNGFYHIWVHERVARKTSVLHVETTDGNDISNHISAGTISGDGRFVVFSSQAANLPLNDGKIEQSYIYDRLLGTTEVLSVNAQGVPGDGGSFSPVISLDGNFVVFVTAARNLTSGDPQPPAPPAAPAVPAGQIIVKNLFTGDYAFASTTTTDTLVEDTTASVAGHYPAISADGRYVAFTWNNGLLVTPGLDVDFHADIFVRDMVMNTTKLVSVNSAGQQTNNDSRLPAISGDGTKVVFHAGDATSAVGLIATDTNGQTDIFLRDLTTNQTRRLDETYDPGSFPGGPNGTGINKTICADGSFVVFSSNATNITNPDVMDASDPANAYDLFVVAP